MQNSQKAGNLLPLKVTDEVTVKIIPDENHEFLMSMKEVAIGYGTSEYSIRQAKIRNSSELIHGKHFVSAVTICHSEPNAPHNKVYWTKRGIVRLGFFIKSKQARLFRDWAEELVISRLEAGKQTTLWPQAAKALPKPRSHNRLTPTRLVSILADVAQIDNREVRLSITHKLIGGQA